MSKLLVDEISDADNTGPVTVTDGLNVSSGNVLIGNGYSIAPLHVYKSSGEIARFSSLNGSIGSILIGRPDTAGEGLTLSYDSNGGDCAISTVVGGHPLIFKSGANERMRINSSGNLAFPTGKGIDFSAVTGGSGTATSNVLSDYEQGNWVPTFAGLAPTSITSAKYVKVGSLVFFSTQIVTPSTASTTYMFIGGLPFGTAADSSASMAYTTSAYFSPAMQVQTTSVYFYKASGASYTMADYSNVHLRFSGHYYTTA